LINNLKLKIMIRDIKNPGDKDGINALHYAADEGNPVAIEKLVLAGWNFDAQSNIGNTPLHYAALKGNNKAVETLLRLGANPIIPDNNGRIPLHMAAQEGKTEVIEALLIKEESPELVNKVDTKNKYTALHMAAMNGHSTVVAYLLISGANINAKDNHGNTALHLAVICDCLGVLETLVELGADINLQNTLYGDTPLHIALHKDNREIIRALNNADADDKIKNKNGATPAIMMEHKISKINLIKEIKDSLPASESKRRLDDYPGKDDSQDKNPRAAQLSGAFGPYRRS
jgi:ankyrin repeat protein